MNNKVLVVLLIGATLFLSGCTSEKVTEKQSAVATPAAVLSLSEALTLANQPGWTLKEAYGGPDETGVNGLTEDGKAKIWSFSFYKNEGGCKEVGVDVVNGVASTPESMDTPACSGDLDISKVNAVSLMSLAQKGGGEQLSPSAKAIYARGNFASIQYLIGQPPKQVYDFEFDLRDNSKLNIKNHSL